MKKISLLLLIFLFSSFFFSVKAEDDKVKIDEVVAEETLGGGVIYKKENVTTKRFNSNQTFNHEVQTLTLKPGFNVKLVPWSVENLYSATKVTIDKIAADYEKNHPGMVVIGGINSEGYWDGSEYPEISNLFMQEGRLMRSGVSSENFKELIVINDDNSHFVKRFPKYSDTLIASLIDESGKVTKELPVAFYNKLPENNNDIAVFTKQYLFEANLSGYYAVYTDYELYRPTTFWISGTYNVSGKTDDIYARGSVGGYYTEEKVTAKNYNQIVYVTKSKELADSLAGAKKIETQYHLLDEFSEAKNIFGYMYKIIENDKVITPNDWEDNSDDFRAGFTKGDDSFSYNQAYLTGGKNRSCIGFKKDGTIVLDIDINGTTGPTVYEVGEYLHSKGVDEAYLFDCGGSVCMTVRNADGTFSILNKGADGHPRSITTGVFFVAEEPSIKIETSRFGAKFTCDDSNVEEFKIECNNKNYSSTLNSIELSNLEEDKTYNYRATFKFKNGSSYTTRLYNFTTKSFQVPLPRFNMTEIGKDYCSFTSNIPLINVFWVHDGISDTVGEGTNFTIKDLTPDTEYNMHFTYSYLDTDSGNTYDGSCYLQNFKTNIFDNPTISKFELDEDEVNKKIKVKYNIKDNDKTISDFIIRTGEDIILLEELKGSIELENIKTTDDIYLEISYNAGSQNSTMYSEKLHSSFDLGGVVDPVKPSGCNSGIIFYSLLSSLSIIYLFKKKNC